MFAAFYIRTPKVGTADIARSAKLDTAHVELKKQSAATDSAVATIDTANRRTVRHADTQRRQADSLNTVADTTTAPAARDSLRVQVIDSLKQSNDSLRAVVRRDSVERSLLVADRDRWKFYADSVVTTMDALRADLKRVESQRFSRGVQLGVGACYPDKRPCFYVGYGANVRLP